MVYAVATVTSSRRVPLAPSKTVLGKRGHLSTGAEPHNVVGGGRCRKLVEGLVAVPARQRLSSAVTVRNCDCTLTLSALRHCSTLLNQWGTEHNVQERPHTRSAWLRIEDRVAPSCSGGCTPTG